MKNLTHRPCPICGALKATPLHTMHFALPENSPLPSTYAIVTCQRCGSVHADTPGSQADYDLYYSEYSHYEDPSIATGGGDSELDALRIAETANRLLPQLADKGKTAHILDIGCARGGLLKALRLHGFSNLHGSDPSPACVAHLQSAGIPASRSLLSSPHSLHDQEPFDLIILSHVLEHLVDVRAHLNYLHSRLTPTGRLYLEVPDASRYLKHPAVPFYYFDCEHINHFSRETLNLLAEHNGFKVITGGESSIALPNKCSYPAVWVLFEADSIITPSIQSARLAKNMTTYIAQSHLAAKYPALEKLAKQACPIVLWGAGSYAQRLLEDSPLSDCRIVAVIDQDRKKQGLKFNGVNIAAPENGLKNLNPDTVIVVAAALHTAEICAQIRLQGYTGEVVLPAVL